MNIVEKLNTLFRASARGAAESLVNANDLRIYAQEIVDAEALLARRRESMAQLIALRKELESEIAQSQQWIEQREGQLQHIPVAGRSAELLQLAASEIAGYEVQLERLQVERAETARQITELELNLRQLIAEIKQHRRDLKLLQSQSRSLHTGSAGAANTLNARLQALRATRSQIGARIQCGRQLEDAVAETGERLDANPLQKELDRLGTSAESQRVAQVLSRLQAASTG